MRVAAYLWSPLSGRDPIQHCNGIFIQFQNGVAFSNLVLYLNFGGQTLKDNIMCNCTFSYYDPCQLIKSSGMDICPSRCTVLYDTIIETSNENKCNCCVISQSVGNLDGDIELCYGFNGNWLVLSNIPVPVC